VTKLNLNRGSTLPNNAWDALLHELDNNYVFFPAKPLLYRGTVTPQSLPLSVTDSVTSHCLTLTLATPKRHLRTIAFQTCSKRELKSTHQSRERTIPNNIQTCNIHLQK